MKKSFRFTWISIALVGAYLLSACAGGLPQAAPSEVAQKVLAKEIVFAGIVEQINGDQWVVSGQAFTVDPAAAMDPGITVGDIVMVEGTVSVDGGIVALQIEASTVGDDNANDGNANDDNSNSNSNSNDDNGSDDNSNTAGDDENEVFGIVEAMTADSITVGGVTYQLAAFTEFKDAIAVGDQVKIHIVVNTDGTFTIREIEKSDGLPGDDNGNDANSNDDNSNDDNGNDDNDNDDNSNDDNGDDDNDNDDNSGHGGGDDDDDGDDENGNDD